MTDIFSEKRTGVRTEAQRERERVQSQAEEEQAKVTAAAKSQKLEAAQQAREVKAKAEAEVEEVKAQAREQVKAQQAAIRKQQSEAERQAEAQKAAARTAQQIEQRKRDLPISKPQDIGAAEFISNVEKARKEAHATGRSVRAAIDKEKDRFFDEVDKATKEALADIDKQKSGIEADIDKAVVEAEAEIAKQKAILDTQVEEWRGDSLEAIDKAQADYNKAVEAFEASHVKLGSGEYITKEDWAKLDKDAQSYLMKFGIEEGTAKYNTALQEKALAEFEAAHIKLDSGEYVTKEDWAKLDTKAQEYLKTSGIDEGTKKYNDYLQAQALAEFETGHIKLKSGEYVAKAEWAKVDQEAQKYLMAFGIQEGTSKYNASLQEAQDKAVAEFEAAHVKLDSGEYVTKEAWAKVDVEAQEYIMKFGIEEGTSKYNVSLEEKALAEFEAAHIKLDSGEYVTKEAWAKVDVEAQKYLMAHGIEEGTIKYKDSLDPEVVFSDMKASGDIPQNAILDSYNKDTGKVAYSIPIIGDLKEVGAEITKGTEYNKAVEAFEADHVKLDSGEYVSKADWDTLDKKAQELIKKSGIELGTKLYNDYLIAEFEKDHVKLSTGEYIEKAEWDKLDSKYQDYLLARGVESGTRLYNQYLEWLHNPLKLYKARMPDGSYITIYAKTQTDAKKEAKERGAYTITVSMTPTDPKATPELYGEKVFANMIYRGDIPKGAIFEGYDAATEKVSYSMPDTRTTVEVFNAMVEAGDIPKDAILDSYNKETGQLQYTVPEIRTPEQILADMITAGDIPSGAILDSYNEETSELSYLIPDPRTPEQMFNDMLESGEIPKDAVFQGKAADGGFTYSSPSAMTVEVETAKGKVTMPLVEWEGKTAIEQFALVLGRTPTKTEWEGYRLMEAGVALPWWKELIPGVADIIGTVGLLIPGEIEEERYVMIRSSASAEWQAAYPKLKWGAAVVTGLERIGFAAAKAFYPEVTVKDVTGKEWAMTALNVALWTLPAWLPKVVKGAKVLIPSKLTARLRTVPFSETAGLQKVPAVSKTVVLTKTVGAKQLGMSGATYNRFLQARVANPQLTPQVFRFLESVKGVVAKPKVASGLPVYTYPRRVGVGQLSNAEWLKLWKPSQVQPAFSPAGVVKGWVVTSSGKYMPAGKTPISLPDVPISLVLQTPIITGGGTIISPVTIDHVVQSLGLKTVQVAGTQPLSTAQANTLAQVLGISQAKVVAMVKQGNMSQVVQQQLKTLQNKLVGLTTTQAVALTEALKKLQAKPLPQTETLALAKALGLTEPKTQTLLKAMTELKPAAKTALKTPPATQVKPAAKTLTQVQPATQTLTQLQPATKLQPAAKTETKLQPATQTLTKTETLTKLKPAAKTAVKLKVKQAVKTKVPIKAKVPTKVTTKVTKKVPIKVPLIPLPDGTSRDMTPKERTGSVAWKQGFIYVLIYPPYGEKNILYSRKPFPGVKIAKGVKSAYKTITKLGIKLPASIKRDMGIMDIEIKTPKKGKGKSVIEFKADPRQVTWHVAGKRGKKRRVTNKKRTNRREHRLTASASIGR